MSAGLSIKGLSAGYGPIRVLQGVDLEAPAGEITVVVGPNGAGKTTLLKAVSGLIPREGEVLFEGEALPTRPAVIVRRGLAQVAEGRQLFPQMSVRENLELGGYLLPRGERDGRLQRVFEFFPRLAERRTQLAGTLSGGEQQMLAVGRALMGKPRLLMLDEPSLGLAPKMIDELLGIVRRIRDDGVTILLVEQNVAKAMAIAEGAYVIERGVVVMKGQAGKLLKSERLRAAYLGAETKPGTLTWKGGLFMAEKQTTAVTIAAENAWKGKIFTGRWQLAKGGTREVIEPATGKVLTEVGFADAEDVQSFTYTFACERRDDGESHVIPRPEKYEHYRSAQPYSLRIEVHGGEIYGETSGWLDYRLYDRMPETKGGLWTYRRLLDRESLTGAVNHDLTMFNWPGNDYRDRSILDCSPIDAARALQDAKRVSLGFLYWLQTEAPATGTRLGAPEIRLRPDVMGTADGLSKHPYIRESRRIRARKTIVEQEVSERYQTGPRAAHFADSVGVGWYPIDIHRSGPDDVGASCRTKPFQIPLGALLPVRIGNLIAGGKNLGTTHITNGCYRLHPVEWSIGEAAGALAGFALEARVTPAAVREQTVLLKQFQRRLLGEGVPLAWLVDVGVDHPAFVPSQLMFMNGALVPGSDLLFHPEARISEAEWRRAGGAGTAPPSRGLAARRLAESR